MYCVCTLLKCIVHSIALDVSKIVYLGNRRRILRRRALASFSPDKRGSASELMCSSIQRGTIGNREMQTLNKKGLQEYDGKS